MSIIDLLSKNEAKRRKAVEDIKNKLGKIDKNPLSPFLVGGDLTKLGEQDTAGKIATISSLMNPLTYLRTGASQLKDVNTMADLALTTTAPYRKGANILAQNYSSAFTGKDMSNPDNQGAFLKYLASGITPEEQQQINNKPMLEAVKSSAGMVSSLMPFTKIGNVAKVGSKIANPAISKLAQLATRGSIEGTVGGFGYSRQGKELQDTLLGMGIGTVGEVAGGLISDPTFRKGIGQEIKKANTGKYSGELNLGDETGDFLNSVKKRGVTGDRLLNVQDMADEVMANGGKINNDGTVTLYHATTPEAKTAIESTGKFTSKEPNLFFSTSPNGQIKGYGDSVVEFKIPLERLELDDVFGTEAHLKMAGEGIGKSTDVSKYINKSTAVKPPTIDPLIEEAKKYKTPEEFVKAQGNTLYHGGTSDIKEIKLGKSNHSRTFYMSDNAKYAESYGGDNSSINKIAVDKNAKLYDLRKPSEKQVQEIVSAIDEKMKGNVPYSDKNFDFYPYTKADVISGIKEGKAHFAELPQIKQILKDLGYDGMITQESKFGANYGVWNKNVLKTKSQLSDIWNQAHSTEQVNKDAMESADKIGDYIFEGRPGNDLYKQQMEILLNKNAKTPKLKEGISYPKQGRLASRAKANKRIPLTSWDDAMKEALLKGRVKIASGKK